jgi:hypothetical protein
MQIDGVTAIGIVLVIISLPYLFGALKESGRIKAPKIGRKSSAFRQFPTFPVQGESDGDY